MNDDDTINTHNQAIGSAKVRGAYNQVKQNSSMNTTILNMTENGMLNESSFQVE